MSLIILQEKADSHTDGPVSYKEGKDSHRDLNTAKRERACTGL